MRRPVLPVFFLLPLLLVGLSACSSGKKCEPTNTRLCLEGVLYRLNSCMEPVDLVEQCECGCTMDATDCAMCPSCTANSCSGHGTCDDASGTAVCTCDTGYAGARCLDCAAGYRFVDGACVEAVSCTQDSCSGHGECDDSSGVPVCTCDDGYIGPTCASQAGGASGFVSVTTSHREVDEGGQIFVMESYVATAHFSNDEQPAAGPIIGPCQMPPELSPPRWGATLDAGAVSIAGGNMAVSLSTVVDGESGQLVYEPVYESELLWSGGETLTFGAPGMAGGGPAFSETLTAPHLGALASLDGNAYPGPTETIFFDPASDHAFTWTGVVEGQVVIVLLPDFPDYWREVICTFDAGAQSGTIPAAVFQYFAQHDGLRQINMHVKVSKEVQAQGFNLTLSAAFEGGDVRNARLQ